MKLSILCGLFLFGVCRLIDGETAEAQHLKSDIASASSSECEMFPDYYQLESCDPALPGELPIWVRETKYMSEEEYFALTPLSYRFVQNDCDSVTLTYPKRIQRRDIPVTSDRVCQYWPEQSLKIGFENVVQAGELRFVGRWLGKDKLEILRSENIGFGTVMIADTFAKRDDGWFTMTREITHGAPNGVGSTPTTLMTCVYRGWRQAPLPTENRVYGPPCEAPLPSGNPRQ